MRLGVLFGGAIAAAAIAFSLPTPARAVPVTETFTATFGPFSVPFTGQSIDVSKFNPALGTLTGVRIDLSISGTASEGVVNSGTRSRTFGGGTASISVVANGPGAGSTTATASSLLASMSIPAHTSLTVTGSTAAASSFYDVTGSLTAYKGIGTVAIPLHGSRSFSGVACGTGLSCTPAAVASGDVRVIYSYLSVPEPAGAAVLGMGLIGLATVRRSRRTHG